MSKIPSFQFYPGDWLRDNISGCSLEAQGLWLRMMILMHDSERYGYLSMDGVPIPPGFVARKCGCDTLRQYTTLLEELTKAGIPSRTPEGVIYSRRMVRDAHDRERKTRNQAEKRLRDKENSEDMSPEKSPAMSPPCHHGVTEASPRSSSSSSSSKKDTLAHLPPAKRASKPPSDPDFERFWQAYPKKKSKGDAIKAWKKLNGTKPPIETILAAIAAQSAGHDWQKDGGQFIKYPASWLNAMGWLDEATMQIDQAPDKPRSYTDDELESMMAKGAHG